MVDKPGKPNEDMLPAERRQRVQDWFQTKVAASSQELSRHFNTSISTIRRDLDYLAAQGVIRRTHGGAVRIRQRATFEPTLDEARRSATEEKRAIARMAALRIEPEQSLLMDTGSTLHELAHVVAEMDLPLTVVTNDIYIAGVLTGKRHINLVMPGGSRREGAYTLLGEPGIDFLKDLRCDQFFVCSQAIDLDCISDISPELVQLKRAMLNAAEKNILLVDSSKFMSRAFYRIADLERIDEIITDDGLDTEYRQDFEQSSVTLTCAPVDEERAGP